MKVSRAKPSDDGLPRIDLAVPAFGYKNHLGIDRRHGLIRTWATTRVAGGAGWGSAAGHSTTSGAGGR